MNFSNLTNDNIVLYAVKFYDNPECRGVHEFNEDLDRIKYIKRLFKRYLTKGVLKERLIINHIHVLYNVFGVEAATRILFFRLESDLWPVLKTFLVFLNFMPERVHGIDGQDIISSDIALDQHLVTVLRSI
jgi:hypothetical protein